MDPSVPEPVETIGAIAKRTFLAWEKLRLIYVGILGVETILFCVLASELFFDPSFCSYKHVTGERDCR
jgi:hypothetical protein